MGKSSRFVWQQKEIVGTNSVGSWTCIEGCYGFCWALGLGGCRATYWKWWKGQAYETLDTKILMMKENQLSISICDMWSWWPSKNKVYSFSTLCIASILAFGLTRHRYSNIRAIEAFMFLIPSTKFHALQKHQNDGRWKVESCLSSTKWSQLV